MTADTSLQDDALKLAELDQQVIRAFVEGDVASLEQAMARYWTLRKSLATQLLDRSTVAIPDGTAADVLKKIAGGDGLSSDKLIERLVGEGYRITDLDAQEIEELGSELFYSWFSHREYLSALAETSPVGS